MSKSSNKKRLKQLRNWLDNELKFKKSKRNVQNKNGRKKPEMQELSKAQLKAVQRVKKVSLESVSVKLSSSDLKQLKRLTGLRGNPTNSKVVSECLKGLIDGWI